MALRVDDVDLARDSRLVARFQEGDRDAFDDLYRRYFARLRRYCLQRVGDPHEAEELAQEAFVRALRAMPTFEGERRFYPWMTVIAGRLCIDSHRRRARTEPVDFVDLGTVDGGQDQLVDEVDVRQLAQAMARLAPRHREVLELRAIHEWSYQQIAEHYGVNMGTVESLLHRARKTLRRELDAITGDTPTRLATLPGMAWLARRLHDLRARVTTDTAGLAEVMSPLAVKAASVVVAVGAGVLLGPGPVPASPAAHPAPVAIELARSDAPLAVAPSVAVARPAPAPAPVVPALHEPLAAMEEAGPPPAPAGHDWRDEATVAVVSPVHDEDVVTPAPTDPGTAKEEAEKMPVHAELPSGTTVGANPDAPVEKTQELVDDVQGRLS